MKTLGIIFITCLLYSGLAFSDYILFNQTGERIHLKDDGTWENLGVPEKKDGLVVTNTKLMDREYLYDGEKRTKCAITATIQNNTPYDLKGFGLSYKVYDDYDDSKMFMYADDSIIGKLPVGKSRNAEVHIPRSCDHYTEKGWYVVGGINEYTFQLKDKSVDPALVKEMIIYSNDGVLSFKNGK